MIDQKSKGYLYGACRRIFRWSPARTQCLKLHQVGDKIKLWICASCDGKTKEPQVDHIKPIGSWVDWNTFIDRLFCDSSNLQVLCKKCHKLKTKKEAHERAKSH